MHARLVSMTISNTRLTKTTVTPGVLQHYPLKRISSRDSERKTLKGRGADQPSKPAGQNHTRKD